MFAESCKKSVWNYFVYFRRRKPGFVYTEFKKADRRTTLHATDAPPASLILYTPGISNPMKIPDFQPQPDETILYQTRPNPRWYAIAWKILVGLVGILSVTVLVYALFQGALEG